MPEWHTKLAVSWEDKSGNEVITPVESFAPNFTIGATALHSIEATHIGAVYTPDAMAFSITVKAIGKPAAELTILAMEHKRFKILLVEQEGTDWSFEKVILEECVITGAQPSTVTPSGAPTAVFSGISLKANAESAEGIARLPLP
jgi:hypothetical protein